MSGAGTHCSHCFDEDALLSCLSRHGSRAPVASCRNSFYFLGVSIVARWKLMSFPYHRMVTATGDVQANKNNSGQRTNKLGQHPPTLTL